MSQKSITSNRETGSCPVFGRPTGIRQRRASQGISYSNEGARRTGRREEGRGTVKRSSRVAIVSLNSDSRAPTIIFKSKETVGPIEVMIDTGCELNLLKIKIVYPETYVDQSEILKLTGITSEQIVTLGKIQSEFHKKLITFHLVNNDFPIENDGIIGSEFLKQNHIDVLYSRGCLLWDNMIIEFAHEETIDIPARTRKGFYVRISNPQIITGYVPRMHIDKGVYFGEALVTCRNGKAFMYIYNTNSKNIEVVVPVITLESYKECYNCKNQENLESREINENKNLTYSEICKEGRRNQNKEANSQIKKIFSITNPEKRVKQILDSLRLGHLNEEEKEGIVELIRQHQDVYHLPGDILGATHLLEHKINTTDDTPINIRQYRYPPLLKDEIDKQTKELLADGLIQPSTSPYNTPVWIVPKKPDSQGNKQWRMVLDFRALNEKTVGDAFPLPLIHDILDQLGGARYFSVLDLKSGYHHVKIREEDRHKTAFSALFGHFEFVRMPFGLKTAPATFQRLVNIALSGLQGTELLVYMDDIIIYSGTLEEHFIKLDRLMKRLRDANLKLQPDKCEFLRREVAYLGHIIGADGVRPDPKKLIAVKEFPQPKNVKNIRQFLGLAGYYRRFIPKFSQIAKPLTNLLKKNGTFEWKKPQQEAFEILRDKLCEEPVLQYPDMTQPFIVTTDASGIAIAGILSQGPLGKDRPVEYTSRVLNENELKYSTYEKEALAILHSVAQFRPYLYGKPFKLVTDHKPLVWLQTAKDPTSRLTRWRLKLQEYQFEVVYKAGKTNINADALSRNPPKSKETENNDKQVLVLTRQQLKQQQQQESQQQQEEDEKGEKSKPQAKRKPGRPKKQKDHENIPGPSTSKKEKKYVPKKYKDEKEDTSDSSDQEEQDLPISSRLRKKVKTPKRYSFSDKLQTKMRRIFKKQESPSEDESSETVFTETLEDEEEASEQETPKHKKRKDKSKIKKEIKRDSTKRENVIEEEILSISGESEGTYVDRSISEHSFRDDIELNLTKSRINRITETQDQIYMQKGNYLYFLNEDGSAADEGAKRLNERSLLPKFKNLRSGKILRKKMGKRMHIAIIVDKGLDDEWEEIIQELMDILRDAKIKTINIAKTKLINGTPWSEIIELLREYFSKSEITLNICLGIVRYAEKIERRQIIEEAHASPIGGHKGITKTYNRIRTRYYWEDMKLDIQKFIKQCLSCQLAKLKRIKTKQPMQITDTPEAAFDKVSLDIVGPLPRTMNGNIYILTIQDLLTKLSLAVPLQSITSEEVAKAFTRRMICTYGAPKSILTDQGTNFNSQLMKEFAKIFKIKQYRTTAFHPQSNGSLERSHHSLIEYLKQFVTEEEEWDEWLELATFSYNTSVHEGTKYTPYQLVFGKNARLPSGKDSYQEDILTYEGYLVELTTKLYELQNKARENLIRAKERSKKQYDRKANSVNFRVGESVFLLVGQKKGKFSNQYTGPYEILDIKPDGNIQIKIDRKVKIIHPNRLFPTNINNSNTEDSSDEE